MVSFNGEMFVVFVVLKLNHENLTANIYQLIKKFTIPVTRE